MGASCALGCLKFSSRIFIPLTERPGPIGDWPQGLRISPQSWQGFGHSLMGGSEDGDICLPLVPSGMSSHAANLRGPECAPVWELWWGKPCRVGRASGINWKKKQILPPTKCSVLGRAFHLSEPISSSVKWEWCELRSHGALGDIERGKLSSFIVAFGFPMAALSSEMCLLFSKEGIPPGLVARLPAAWLTVCSPLACLTAAPEGELNSWRQGWFWVGEMGEDIRLDRGAEAASSIGTSRVS